MKLTIYFQFVPKFYIFVAYAAPDFGMVGERFHDFALLQYLKAAQNCADILYGYQVSAKPRFEISFLNKNIKKIKLIYTSNNY